MALLEISAGSGVGTVSWPDRCLCKSTAEAQAPPDQLHDLPEGHAFAAFMVHQHSLTSGWLPLPGIHYWHCSWSAATEFYSSTSWADTCHSAELERSL